METDFRIGIMQTNAHVQIELGNNEFGSETKLIMRPRHQEHSTFNITYKRKLNNNGGIEFRWQHTIWEMKMHCV